MRGEIAVPAKKCDIKSPQLAHGSSSIAGANRIQSLDALRGIAILAVLAVHCGFHYPAMGPVAYNITWAGRYGVEFFLSKTGVLVFN
jgi:peptidoglycan/LPS O-acetylase OafA/YrhL